MAAEIHFLPTDSAVLEMLRRGEERGLVILYKGCQAAVRSYVLRNHGTPDDADDLLQEAVIILWERVRSGRFEYSAKLETFIVAVVKNIWLRRLSRKRREIVQDPGDIEEVMDAGDSPIEILMEEEQTSLLARALRNLGEPCRTLLLLFYYEERSMEEIATTLGFANADTAKSKKYQCKKALQTALAKV
ncbi:MAG: sigma-70 family RNA polymerase sigma factor [Bacteroidota bacterium]